MLFPQNVCISGSGDCLLSDLSCLSVTSEDLLQCKSSFRGNIYVKLLRCYYTLKDHSFSGQLSLSSSSPCLYVYYTVSELLVHLRTDLVGLFDKRQGSDETNVVNFDIRELLIIITKTKIPTARQIPLYEKKTRSFTVFIMENWNSQSQWWNISGSFDTLQIIVPKCRCCSWTITSCTLAIQYWKATPYAWREWISKALLSFRVSVTG